MREDHLGWKEGQASPQRERCDSWIWNRGGGTVGWGHARLDWKGHRRREDERESLPAASGQTHRPPPMVRPRPASALCAMRCTDFGCPTLHYRLPRLLRLGSCRTAGTTRCQSGRGSGTVTSAPCCACCSGWWETWTGRCDLCAWWWVVRDGERVPAWLPGYNRGQPIAGCRIALTPPPPHTHPLYPPVPHLCAGQIEKAQERAQLESMPRPLKAEQQAEVDGLRAQAKGA